MIKLHLPINAFFYKFLFNSFYNFVPYIKKFLKIYHLNIIKKIKKDYKKKLVKDIKIFLKKKKKKKRQYGCERYKSLSEEEKEKLVEYRKKFYRMRKIVIL